MVNCLEVRIEAEGWRDFGIVENTIADHPNFGGIGRGDELVVDDLGLACGHRQQRREAYFDDGSSAKPVNARNLVLRHEATLQVELSETDAGSRNSARSRLSQQRDRPGHVA